MSEEEKKAIERVEDNFYADLGKGISKFQKITLYEDDIRDIRALLNLIEKLQKENEELTKYYIKWCEQRPSLIHEDKIKNKIKELKKEIEEDKKENSVYHALDIQIKEEIVEILEDLLKEE